MTEPLLDVRDLKVHFAVYRGFVQRLLGGGDAKVHAVDGVSLSVAEGEVFGLVGESGCGKTTIAKTLVGLVRASSGKILFRGEDVTHPEPKGLFRLREHIQLIYQDPHAALSPAMTVGEAVADVLRTHGLPTEGGERVPAESETAIRKAVYGIFDDVGLRPPSFYYEKYPDELSGGQKQRVVAGRVLGLRPQLIVADEPVAMLDMSVRARMLEFLMELKAKYHLTYLFITHDLATAKFMCDRIGIMYLGRIVEMGPARTIYANPKHPYTRALLQAIPIPDPERRSEKVLPRGEVPNAVWPPAGCRFHPRCPVALPTCGWEGRDFIAFLEERWLSSDLASREAAAGPPDAWKANELVVRRDVARENEKGVEGLVKEIVKQAGGPMAQAVYDIRVEDAQPPAWVAGISYGLVAALLGGTLWGLIAGLGGYVFGIVAVVIGWAVAAAVRRGAERVTPGIVGLGVALTLLGVFVGDVTGLTIVLWRLGFDISIVNVLAAYPIIVAASPGEAAIAYLFGLLGAAVAARRLRREMKESRSVVVEFLRPDPLGPKQVEDRTVECLLY